MARTNNKDVHRGVVLYLDGKEIPNNARAIRAEMKKVRTEIDGMTRGTEEYNRAAKKIRTLDAALQHHRAQLKSVEMAQESLFAKGKRWLKDYSVALITTFEALTGVAMQLNKFRKMAAEQEDAAANLKALTGLDDDNIAWLKQQAEMLSTTMEASGLRVRKSATEILEAYMLVGSKKPELLKDKEALNAVTIEAMRLAEAAKMELKDAVAGVTLAMNQYGASAEEAARYVNVLAAGSKFGAVGVATQTESIVKAGVAANMAKVPIEQLVGVLETLGERGIEGQIAGTQLKTFFLKLEAGAKETRPSVVGLQQALETLAAKNLSVTELTKMFGLESISTAQALISSADKVKYYTDAVTGTNTAVEQAAINSDTTAARMAQVRNQINLTGQELAKTLAPMLNKTVGWTRRFVMMLPGLIDWLKKWGLEVVVLTAAYATYTYGTRAAEAVTRAWHATQLLVTTTIGRMRAAVQLTTLAIDFNRKAMIQLGLQMRSMNALGKLFVATQALVRAGFLAITGHATQAARAMTVARMAVATINPWAAAATAIAAVGTALFVYYNRTKEALHVNKQLQQAQDDAATRYEEQKFRIDNLVKTVHDETLSYQRRNTALEELKRLVPDYHASLSQEGKLIDDNTEAIDKYLQRLKKQIALKALEEQYVETLTNKIRAQRKVEDAEAKAAKAYNRRRDIQEGPISLNPVALVATAGKWAGLSAREQYYDWQKNRAQEELHNAEKDGEEIQKMIDDITRQLDETFQKVENIGADSGPGGSHAGGNSSSSDRQKRVREAIEAINAKYDARANDMKQQYIDGQIQTEEEYSKQLQDIELERLNKQLEIAGMEPAQREQIRGKILDMKMKLMEQLKQLEEKQKKEEEQAATERLNISRQTLQDALLEMRRTKIEEGLTEEEYNDRILQMRRAFYKKVLEDKKLSDKDRLQLQREENELEISEEERKQQKLEELAKKQKDRLQQLFDTLRSAGEEFGEALGEWLTDTETSFKDFSKDLLKIIVKTVKNIMTAAIAERTIINIKDLGFWGVAKAAGEIALIEAAGAALNGLISNFYTGGYTGKGQWDEPRGVVHAGEFVANRYAVANDAVRPVLDLIDQAQRNGSIANLTANDIAAVARPSTTPTPAATAPGPSAAGIPVRDPELTAALRLLIRTTERAAEAYREPSMAYTFADGRGGVNEAQELLARMKSNASRKH